MGVSWIQACHFSWLAKVRALGSLNRKLAALRVIGYGQTIAYAL
jgi:hypothetical protein